MIVNSRYHSGKMGLSCSGVVLVQKIYVFCSCETKVTSSSGPSLAPLEPGYVLTYNATAKYHTALLQAQKCRVPSVIASAFDWRMTDSVQECVANMASVV